MDQILSIIFEGLLAILAIVIVKYLIPWLAVAKRKAYADHIFRIADDITDDLIERHPDNQWLKFLDSAVDKMMEICGVSKDVANRAINAQVTKKKNGNIMPK
jgi:hypothetical protein